jgi:hypothetical protein
MPISKRNSKNFITNTKQKKVEEDLISESELHEASLSEFESESEEEE